MTFGACTDPYRFHIKGEIDNLRQADFLVYSTDGGLATIDTIHVNEGTFKWSTPLTEESTFYIVFPNLSEQVVFGQPGATVRLEGDANELRSVRVTGTEDNEALTEFRLSCMGVSPSEHTKTMEAYVSEHPDSRVGIYLRQVLTQQQIGRSNLKKGQRLPSIILPPDNLTATDTLTLDAGQPLLLIFWASWSRESTANFFDIHRLTRQVADLPAARKIRPVGISLDVNPDDYASTCRYDSVTWESRCYRRTWGTPVVEQLDIRELPYYVLTDADLRIVALGTRWKEDIQEALFDMIHSK